MTLGLQRREARGGTVDRHLERCGLLDDGGQLRSEHLQRGLERRDAGSVLVVRPQHRDERVLHAADLTTLERGQAPRRRQHLAPVGGHRRTPHHPHHHHHQHHPQSTTHRPRSSRRVTLRGSRRRHCQRRSSSSSRINVRGAALSESPWCSAALSTPSLSLPLCLSWQPPHALSVNLLTHTPAHRPQIPQLATTQLILLTAYGSSLHTCTFCSWYKQIII